MVASGVLGREKELLRPTRHARSDRAKAKQRIAEAAEQVAAAAAVQYVIQSMAAAVAIAATATATAVASSS